MAKKTPPLNDRSLQLLKILVERYISDGQPVGSRALAKDCDFSLSPATIRNVMADLEDLGLVCSPHTSAGRVPTASGYRLFVDSLLTVKPLDSRDLSLLHDSLLVADDDSKIVSKASRLLAELTQMAGVVTLPKREIVSLRQIEFLPLANTRVLVIFVTNEQEVHNRIIHTERPLTPAELQAAANYLNSTYSGQSLCAVKEAVVGDLLATKAHIDQGMRDAIAVARQALTQDNGDDGFVLAGETNLMGLSELADIDRLKSLFEAFSQKQAVIHLLEQCLQADGVQIFIGEESGYREFRHCSLVTSSYSAAGQVLGVLGVIGPTRMNYQKIIPFVDVTAKLLGAALNPKSPAPL